jgi:hypothetical protein
VSFESVLLKHLVSLRPYPGKPNHFLVEIEIVKVKGELIKCFSVVSVITIM